MVDAVPAIASIELYNELLSLEPEEMVRAAQIEWTLLGTVRRNPADLLSRIALTTSMMHQGKAEAALEQIEHVWPSRSQLPFAPMNTLQAQLIDLGQYERAKELFDVLGTDFHDARRRSYEIAFNIGNVEEARDVGGYMDRLFLDRLDASGLVTFFPDHQAIVRAALLGRQVSCDVQTIPSSGSEGPEVAQAFYLSGTYAERTALESSLFDQIDAYYSGKAINSSDAWDIMTPMLMDVSSRRRRQPT